MIFTPTSWLIPRPTYEAFRNEFDKHFIYKTGFIITSNEFFDVPGKWPLTFTIWTYNYDENGNKNKINIWDYTYLKQQDLAEINWSARIKDIDFSIKKIIRGAKQVKLDNSRKEIRDLLPKIKFTGKKQITQPRYNIYRNLQEDEKGKRIVSGFPLLDDRHTRVQAPHGFVDGNYVGFMDDSTPVRLVQERFKRLSQDPDRIWFRLDTDFKGINKAKIFNGPADNRSYCAYDLNSAKATLTWYSIAKVCNGKYPLWANQLDIWKP